MNNTKITVFLSFIFLLFSQFTFAGNRYVYIQGDKQIPFVVAVEGYSLPKLGQHYCIIPNLEPGEANITITFQSSDYPIHKFKIKIPEHSSRGFILTKVSDKTYALFDMQTQAYIMNNNKEDEAFLAFNPEEFNSLVRKNNNNTSSVSVTTKPNTPVQETTTIPISERNKNNSKTNNSNNKNNTIVSNNNTSNIDTTHIYTENNNIPNKSKIDSSTYKPTLVKPDKNKNKNTTTTKRTEFLEDIDLNKSKEKTDEKNKNKNKDKSISNLTTDELPNKFNCEQASTNEEFERFSSHYVNKRDDTEKLKYIRKNINKICLNTSQVLILSNFLDGQSSKFELFSLLKNVVTDKENYHKLQNVFNTEFMKEKFLNMIK